MAYLRPSVSIQQEFALLPTSITQNLNAVLVGPRKKIVDYKTSSNLSELSYGLYEDVKDVWQAFIGLPAGSSIYSDSIKLTLQEVLAKYATLSGNNVIRKSATAANQITLGSNPTASGSFKGSDRNVVFKNRDVQIGDRVSISVGGSPVLTTRVTDYVASQVPASFGEFQQGAFNATSQTYSDSTETLEDMDEMGRAVIVDSSAGLYRGNLAAGIISETYVLTCSRGGLASEALWNITSTAGDNVSNVTIPSPLSETPFQVGTRGLFVIILGGSPEFIAGESYRISVTSEFVVPLPRVVSSGYEGSVGTTYVVTVVKGGTWDQNPMVAVTTTNGIDYSPATIVASANSIIPLGALGASFKMSDVSDNPQGGLRQGDTYTVSVSARTAGPIRTLALASPLPSSITSSTDLSVDFLLHKKEIHVPVSGYPSYGSQALEFNVESGAFAVSSGLQILDPSWTASGTTTQLPLPVVSAQVYVSYTALLRDNVNSYNSITNLSDITSQIGEVTEENELAYAAFLALGNSGGQTVYWVAVDQDNLEGYLDALAALESAQSAYFIVPLSDKLEIQQAFKGHVQEMSLPTYGLERVALVSTPVSQTIELLSQKTDGSFWSGYVEADPNNSFIFNRVTIPGASLVDSGIRAGDIFRTNYVVNSDGTQSFQSALVSQVLDNETIVLANPSFTSAVGSSEIPVRVDISRLLTKSEYASEIAAVSSSFGSRRVYNIWPSQAVNANGVTVPGYFVAAAVAGLKSSVAPQQGITNYVVNGFSSLKLSGQFFTPTQLDTIAGGGTLIVSQDVNGGPVYIRHQISTDQRDANHSELSITTNLDSISKYIRPQLKSLIGVYNITPAFLLSAKALLMRNLDYLTAYTSTPTAGPQVISYNVQDIVVVQDPLLATRVIAKAPVRLPYPLNNFDLTLIVV